MNDCTVVVDIDRKGTVKLFDIKNEVAAETIQKLRNIEQTKNA